MAKKNKNITKQEFNKIQNKNWAPVILEDNDIPSILSGIPKEKLCLIVGSGSAATKNPEADGNLTLPNQVGGIDVYRYAEEKDDAELNKDWYRIVENPDNPDSLYLIGPIRDHEHWIDDIPERLVVAKVFKKE